MHNIFATADMQTTNVTLLTRTSIIDAEEANTQRNRLPRTQARTNH